MKTSDPNELYPKLFDIHQAQHDGRPIGEPEIEYFPDPPKSDKRVASLDTEKLDKINALRKLDMFLGEENRARALNLSQMTPGHPLAKKFDLETNAVTVESILDEARVYLAQACGHCALEGTVGCKINSNAKKFVANHPTGESRETLIENNWTDPNTSC